jgi:hypothetical protein
MNPDALIEGQVSARSRALILAVEALATIIVTGEDPVSVETAKQALEDVNAVLGEAIE